MTSRRYYNDATTVRFDTFIVERTTHDGHPAIVLDQTYFYPTSGGQPHDIGQIADGRTAAAVVDVFACSPDAPVLHVLDRPLNEGDQVTGIIDWARRFDHMQQHTGQHILSQAFLRVAEAETVGFHLSRQTVTIDINSDAINEVMMEHVEQLANNLVWADVPVAISQVSPEEAMRLPLRKIPTKHSGTIRLVSIGDFDLSACGGTHVAATGQVGLIKIVRTERRGDLTRIEFRCGGRVVEDYGRKNTILAELSGNLTTSQDDLVNAASRLQEEARQWRSTAISLEKELSAREADRLVERTPVTNGLRAVIAVYQDLTPERLRQIVGSLTEHPDTVALLATTGERTHFVFGRALDAPGHMGDLLRATVAQSDGAKGGGSAVLAQGGGPRITTEELELLLQTALSRLP